MSQLKVTFKHKDKGEVYIVLREITKNKRIRITKNMSVNDARILEEMLYFIFDEEDVYQLDVEKMNVLKRKFCIKANLNLLDFEVINVMRIADELIGKIVFEQKKFDCNSIEDRYISINENRYKNKIINILLKGAFGSGKSTVIKKGIGILDEIDIPVTDEGRTTSYEIEYIFTHNKKKSFIVLFSKYNDIYSKFEECFYRAENKYLDIYFQNNELDENDIKSKVIESFYTDPQNLFKIFYTIGKYYSQDNLIKRYKDKYEDKMIELKEQLNFWENIYNNIKEMLDETIRNQGIIADGKDYEIIKQLISDEIKKTDKIDGLVNECISYTDSKVKQICAELEDNGLGEVIFDENDDAIGFYCQNYEFDMIEEYLRIFTSTNAKYFSKLLTPLVDRIRIEVPFNLEAYGVNELEEYTIIMRDTIGTAHQNELSTDSIEGSSKTNYEEFDLVIAVDNARRPMDTTIINILRELINNTINEKIIIAYTHYDEFSKKDHEDEYSKQLDLESIQEAAINSIDKRYYSTLKESTIILKNLIFTKKYENEKSIKDFFNLIINKYRSLYDFKAIKPNNPEKQLLVYSQPKLGIIYENLQQKYIEIQKERYLKRYPQYKVTEALTRRLMQGRTYYIGAESLKPIDDFVKVFMEQIKEYIFSPIEINFTPKCTIDNHVSKVEDWLKEKISSKIKQVAEMVFINWQNDSKVGSWREAYLYSSVGSDSKRRNKIIDVFTEYLPEAALDNSKPYADFWLEKISEIIIVSLNEMKNEIMEEI